VLLNSYFINKDRTDPVAKKKYGISVVIPVWNEEKTLGKTLDSVLDMLAEYDGPGEVVLIDNNSTDGSVKVITEYMQKHKNVVLIYERKKQGKSFAVNTGIKAAKHELIVTIDADSFPKKDSLKYMVGYFNDPKVGAVVTKLCVEKPKGFIEHFQNIEYFYSNFYILALEFLSSIHVARGPLSAFRKDVLLKIGGFIDPKITPTEDMEITFRIRKAGYDMKVSKNAFVSTRVMPNLKAWYVQRMRWNTGTMRTFIYHKDMILDPKYGLFGVLVAPFIMISFFLVFFVVYYLIRELINNYNYIYSSIWNLVHGVMPDFYWLNIAYNQPIFYVPYFVLFMFVSLTLLFWVYYIAFKESNAKIRTNFFYFIAYLFIYYVFLLATIIISMGKVIIGKDVPWR